MKTRYPDFLEESAVFLGRVLKLQVLIPATRKRPVVSINDTTKAIAYTGEVIIEPGRVFVNSLSIGHEDRRSSLGELLSDLLELGATQQELVDAVRALHGAGLLNAELRTR